MPKELVQHELGKIFPAMSDMEFDDLKTDMAEHGQHVPVEVYEGKVLDGWHRYKACLLLGIEPVTIDVEVDDPIGYVIALNLHRRHLSTSQKAMVAERIAKSAKMPGVSLGKTREKLQNAFQVSPRSMKNAAKVESKGSEPLKQAVVDGKIPVSQAAKIADKPKQTQNKMLRTGNHAAIGRELKSGQEQQTVGEMVKDLESKFYGPLIRGIDSVARANGGQGPAHKAAMDSMGQVLKAIRHMGKGNK